MTRRVKVTEMLAPYAHEGVSYGPFRASEDRPFLEVPERLASALNLPLHESEVQARGEAQASEGEDLGSLREQLAQVERERDHLDQLLKGTADEVLKRGDFVKVPRFDDQHPDGMDVRQAVAAGFDGLKTDLDKAHADLVHEQRQHEKTREGYAKFAEEHDALKADRDTLAAKFAEAQARSTLPEDARERLVKLPKIGEKLADDVLEALKATPE